MPAVASMQVPLSFMLPGCMLPWLQQRSASYQAFCSLGHLAGQRPKQNASCLQSTSRAIPSSIHDPPSVEDTTTEGLAYQNDIDQLQQQIASQLEGQDTQTVSEAKAAVQQVVQQYQGTASMSQLIQVRPSKVACRGAGHQHLPSTVGAQWMLWWVRLRSRLSMSSWGSSPGTQQNGSPGAGPESPAGISDGASSHCQPGGVCPQALDLAGWRGVAAGVCRPCNGTPDCCDCVSRPCSLLPNRRWLHRHCQHESI